MVLQVVTNSKLKKIRNSVKRIHLEYLVYYLHIYSSLYNIVFFTNFAYFLVIPQRPLEKHSSFDAIRKCLMFASRTLCPEVTFVSKSVGRILSLRDYCRAHTKKCGKVTIPSSVSRGQTSSRFGVCPTSILWWQLLKTGYRYLSGDSLNGVFIQVPGCLAKKCSR